VIRAWVSELRFDAVGNAAKSRKHSQQDAGGEERRRDKTMKANRICWVVVVLAVTIQSAWAFYNPQTGRWLNRDPIEEQGGHNVYVFARNDTQDQIDAMGMTPHVVVHSEGYAFRDPWPWLLWWPALQSGSQMSASASFAQSVESMPVFKNRSMCNSDTAMDGIRSDSYVKGTVANVGPEPVWVTMSCTYSWSFSVTVFGFPPDHTQSFWFRGHVLDETYDHRERTAYLNGNQTADWSDGDAAEKTKCLGPGEKYEMYHAAAEIVLQLVYPLGSGSSPRHKGRFSERVSVTCSVSY
jgi:hypothetical protein